MDIDSLLSALGKVIDLAAPAKQGIEPLLSFDPGNLSKVAIDADARRHEDKADPTAQNELRDHYVTAYGFPRMREGAPGKPIWCPWLGVTVGDLEVTLRVSQTLEVPPSHVLALWIQEGKHAYDGVLHGKTRLPLLTTALTKAVKLAQIRAWVRSEVWYGAFGSDKYTVYGYNEAIKDNAVLGPESAHTTKFNKAFKRLVDENLPGPAQKGVRAVRDYFTNLGGALSGLKLTDADGNTLPEPVPEKTVIKGSVALRPNSLASWVYLQHGLFLTYRSEIEKLFNDEYGGGLDLSLRPWVTYVGWNGGVTDMYNKWFAKQSGTPDDRIEGLFGDPPAAPLDATEKRNYSDFAVSISALANAIQFKYLIDSVEPWFESE